MLKTMLVVVAVLLFAGSALAITEEELLAMEEGAGTGEVDTSSSSSTVTLNWGDNTTIGPFVLTAAGFSDGTLREEPEKCNSEYTDYEKQVFFGCMDYVILKLHRDGALVWTTALSDHNISREGAEFTNISTYEDSDFTLTLHATEVVTGYHIPSPHVTLKVELERKEKLDKPDKPPVRLVKIVPEWAYRAYSEGEGDIHITLEVENLGDRPFSARLHDHEPDCFTTNDRLNWSLHLEPGERWQTGYFLAQANCTEDEYVLPPATLEINGRFYNSSSATLRLYGSRITINKSLHGNTVSVQVRNEGNRASRVVVRDSLPEGVGPVSGRLNFTVILQPGEEHTNTYTLTKAAWLPPAVAEFYDYNPSEDRGVRSGVVWSQSVEIPEAHSKPPPVHIDSNIHTPAPQHASDTGILNRVIDFFKQITRKMGEMIVEN